MEVSQYKNIELISAFSRMASFPGKTYSTSTTLARLKYGKKFVYLEPYGEGWECEGGHYIKILTQEEFDHLYSLSRQE